MFGRLFFLVCVFISLLSCVFCCQFGVFVVCCACCLLCLLFAVFVACCVLLLLCVACLFACCLTCLFSSVCSYSITC